MIDNIIEKLREYGVEMTITPSALYFAITFSKGDISQTGCAYYGQFENLEEAIYCELRKFLLRYNA